MLSETPPAYVEVPSFYAFGSIGTFQLSSCTRNIAPVPYREDVKVFISSLRNIGTSVGHEIGFQVSLLPYSHFLVRVEAKRTSKLLLGAHM